MTPETFNAALAQRKLEAADLLLIQAKRGSDADRIRAASAVLRIAFIPTPTRATDRLSSAGRCSTPMPRDPRPVPDSTSASGAPESPQPREEIPGDAPQALQVPSRAGAPSPLLTAAAPHPSSTHTPVDRVPVNSS
ncbi:MAG: hypothetical protein ACREJO_13625 [Phycisphaerales bacterium]